MLFKVPQVFYPHPYNFRSFQEINWLCVPYMVSFKLQFLQIFPRNHQFLSTGFTAYIIYLNIFKYSNIWQILSYKSLSHDYIK